MNPSRLTELATSAGLTTEEVRAVQRRFGSLLHKQKAASTCHLTQDIIAEMLDVKREAIRRSLVKAGQRVRVALHDLED